MRAQRQSDGVGRLAGGVGVVALLVGGASLLIVAGPWPPWPTSLPSLSSFPNTLRDSYLPDEVLRRSVVLIAWLIWGYLLCSTVVTAAAVLEARRGQHGTATRLSFALTPSFVRSCIEWILLGAVTTSLIAPMTLPTAGAASWVHGRQRVSLTDEGLAGATPVLRERSLSSAEQAKPLSSPTAPQAPVVLIVLTRPGDTLWCLAAWRWGNGVYWPRLMDANYGRRLPDGQAFTDPHQLAAGWALVVPVDSDSASTLLEPAASRVGPKEAAPVIQASPTPSAYPLLSPTPSTVDVPRPAPRRPVSGLPVIPVAAVTAVSLLAAAALARHRWIRTWRPPLHMSGPPTEPARVPDAAAVADSLIARIRQAAQGAAISRLEATSQRLAEALFQSGIEVELSWAREHGNEVDFFMGSAGSLALKTVAQRLEARLGETQLGTTITLKVVNAPPPMPSRVRFWWAPAGYVAEGVVSLNLLGEQSIAFSPGRPGDDALAAFSLGAIASRWATTREPVTLLFAPEAPGSLRPLAPQLGDTAQAEWLEVEALRRARLEADSMVPSIVVVDASGDQRLKDAAHALGVPQVQVHPSDNAGFRVGNQTCPWPLSLFELGHADAEECAMTLAAAMGALLPRDSSPPPNRLPERGQPRIPLDEEAAAPVGRAQEPVQVPESVAIPVQASRITAQCLGAFRLRLADKPLAWPPRHKVRELLAVAFMHRQRLMSKDRILELLWPEAEPERAERELYRALAELRHTVRQALGQPHSVIDRVGSSYRIEEGLFQTDIDAFEEAAVQGLRLETDRAASHLLAAAEAYEGDLFADAEYPWAEAERDRLQTLWLSVICRLAEIDLAGGRPEAAWATLQSALAAAPANEAIHGIAFVALGALGLRAEVTRLYERLQAVLREEFGAEPEAATREAYKRSLGLRDSRASVGE